MDQGFAGSGAPKIQFEGDSITAFAADDIDAHYGPDYDVAINALVGTTAYEQMGNIAADAAKHPQVAVINLGTNDAGIAVTGRTLVIDGVTHQWDPVEPVANVEARLDTIAAEFAPACVVFVTIDTQDPSFYGSTAESAIANAEDINAHIRSMPGIEVADWDAILQPSDFDQPGPHPNEVGRQAMLELEDQAISRCPSSTSTTSSTDTTSTTSTTDTTSTTSS